MKKMLLTGILMGMVLMNYAQQYELATDEHNGKQHKMYLGQITDSLLKADTAFKWFPEAMRTYEPGADIVKTLRANKDKLRFKVFMGTWCEDSHYVVPRFYKILEAAGFNKEKVTMLALDRSKTDKGKIAEALKVTRVPTIIVYNNDTELGRVVEYGETGRFDAELGVFIKKVK